MEADTRLKPIRDLFEDEELRERLAKAQSEEEALGIVVSAGARNDVSFDPDGLRRLIEVLSSPERPPEGDGEQGLRPSAGDTHVHMSCCTDCPSSGSLCC